ncbi:nuclear pore complex protein Nup214 [Drosophila sechellia]|uniref:nuclear pore complex protein Nup214 n=1 Tax=Drosophila sechellia TaxID=7238 RepID=UPI0013DE4942|nr:nuclear pore complex protein Nup214 [Drosophila sechellia]
MAQIAPDCKDTQDFQFKLHHKVVAFKKCGEPRSNVNLLAVSSSRGLLFAGSPTQPELKVIIVKDLVNAKSTGQQPQARLVTLPSIPNYIACNSDGNLLAVNYTQNGTGLLSIYAVISFMTPDVRPVSSIRLAAEDHVQSVQLLWNPVLPNSLAVVLSNGALAMYALKEGGHVEMHSLNKDQQVKCGCWSPKGKQIALGFSGGTVKQFKPDLTLAKQLLCPPNIHDAPFDTIAIQWLSTFQFAVIFLQHGEDCSPSLYILNAPKDGAPRYIKYYDICYSINGPRKDQFVFSHVPQWNLLLVVSANGVEVGIMRSTEAGDSPAWQQLTLLDEARIEMPLSEDKDETFPLGFAFDTSTTHQLTINEQKLQTMPMVHVLSSDGILLSFNFLNMLPTAVSVCSPPPPVADTSGQFKPLNTLLASEEEEQPAWAGSPPTKAPAVTPAASSDISFAFPPNTVTSTPAPSKDKQASLFSGFGAAAAKAPASQLSFGTAPTSSPLSFGAPATNAAKPTTPFGASATNAATPTTPFGGFGTQATTNAMGSMFSASGANAFGGMALNKPAIASVTPRTAAPESTAPATPSASAPANKPLYTVPSTFTPVDTKPDTSAPPSIADESLKPDDIEPIIKDMIALQIEAFSQDIQKQKEQTKELFKSIAAPSALRAYAKRLDDLQELNDQAKDVEFELDVQGLRQGLNEAYAIVAECRGKLEIYRKPEITRLMNSSSCDPSGRRMLARLQSYVAANEAQLRLAQQHVDVQWEQFQDVVRRNSKSRMHMPCLEGIYQRLTRLQNLTSNQRILQNNIKAKLKERGLLQAALLDQEKSRTRTNEAVDTLADSILKMSLRQVVDSNAAKLSRERLQKIRNVVQLQKINVICPQRPDRVGLKSEVILETKRRAEQIKKAAAKPATANKYTQSAVAPPPTPNVASTPAVAPMPQASVTVALSLPKPMPSIPSLVDKPGVPTTPAATSFSFSQSSPFVNTSTVSPTTNTMTPGEAAKPGLSIFGGSTSSSFSFGGGAAKSTLSFGAGSPAVAAPTPKPNPLAAVEKPTPEPTKPKEQNAAMTPGETANPGLSIFGGITSSSFSFGGGATKSTLSFGAGSPAVAAPTPKPNPLAAVEKPTPEPTKPKEQNAALELKAVQPETEESKVPQKPKAETENKSFGFGGFTGTADTAGNTSSSPFSFGGLGSSLGFGGTAAAVPKSEPSSTATTNVATSASTAPFGIFSAALAKPSNSEPITTVTSSTTTITSKPTNVIASSSSTDAPSATNNSAPIGGLFSSVNICKPNTPADNTKPANIFGGGSSAGSFSFGGTTDPSKGLFGSIKSVTSATTAPTSVTEANNKTDPISTTALTISTTTTTTAVSSPAVVSAAVTAAIPASSSTTVTSSTAVPGSAFSFSNAFSTLSAGGAVAPTTTAPPPLTANSPTSTSTGSNSSNSVFGGGFAAATSTAAPVANPFQSAAKSPVSSGNIFGSIPKPETSVFGGVATAPSNTTAAATPAAPPVGLFASAAISNPSPFGSPTTSAPASGVNIFGQAVKPSVFGQPAQAGDSGGSIFGGGSASTPFGSSSIFGGGNTQSAPAAGSTSIFGQKVFGQSSAAAPAEGGNIFSNPVGSPQASPFGGGGNSIFGSPATASPASGGSIFGGGSSSGGFGSFTQTTPAQGGFGGGFGQSGGGSVAQTGFGSPQTAQQQTTTPGGFGGKPVFGGSPAFGASPTFGGGATFGSPKGFGGFGGASPVASPPPFGSAAKPAQGNIFETLGGQESGLSFGNLAQTGNSNAQKPAFGGSSFMNYR